MVRRNCGGFEKPKVTVAIENTTTAMITAKEPAPTPLPRVLHSRFADTVLRDRNDLDDDLDDVEVRSATMKSCEPMCDFFIFFW